MICGCGRGVPTGPSFPALGHKQGPDGAWENGRSFRIVGPAIVSSLLAACLYSAKEQLYCAKPKFESKLSSCSVICGFRYVLCDLCPTLALILGAVTFCIQLRFPAPHY